jgi:hypothetical protein
MGFMFMIFSITTFMAFYVVVVMAVRFWYSVLNDLLMMKFLDKNDERFAIDVISAVPPSKYLNTISSLHLKMTEIIAAINRIFTLPIIFFLTIQITNCTFGLYETYATVIKPTVTNEQLGYTLQSIVANVHLVLYLILVISACTTAMTEKNRTKEILHKIEKQKEVKRKVESFKLQLEHMRMNFSCGMFDFDWQLLYVVRKIH